MDYLTSLQVAEKWNISQRRVAVLCAQNRIPGAVKAGKTWLIPSCCNKPEDGRYECSTNKEEWSVSEPTNSYTVKTELMLNPSLVEASKEFFSKSGKTLSEGINDYLKNVISEQNSDCRSTYPKGFFNLFGCAPDIDIPDNIEDLIPEKVEL